MWIKDIQHLDHLKNFIIENLTYQEDTGYNFLGVYPGIMISDVPIILGIPDSRNLEKEQQQTLYYYASINHPTKGTVDFNKLSFLIWAFNNKPVSILKLHIVYFDTGEDAEAHKNFVHNLITELIVKFGKPLKKSLRNGKERLLYQIGYSELHLWQSSDGLRIQIKKKSSK